MERTQPHAHSDDPKDNVDVNREEAARYGLTIAHVHTAVSSGIGGQNVAENIEGHERYIRSMSAISETSAIALSRCAEC